MAKVDYPSLVSDRDRHGNLRHYVRIKGRPKVRIRGVPGTDEFQQAYKEAMAGKKALQAGVLVPGSFEAMCHAYYRSTEFISELAGNSQEFHRRILDKLCLTIGRKPANHLRDHHVTSWMDARARTPEAANNLRKVLGRLYRWGKKRKLVSIDPTAGISKVRVFTEGFHSWSVAEVFMFIDHHPIGSNARLTLSIALFLGLRRKDVVAVGWQHVKGDKVILTHPAKSRRKKNKVLSIPILPLMAEVLQQVPRTQMTFLQSHWGRPYTDKSVGGMFRKWADEAGLPHCTLHGLRKAGATILANNGATTKQLMAIYGWSKAEMATLYTEAAEQESLAMDGMAKFRLERNNDNGVPLVSPTEAKDIENK